MNARIILTRSKSHPHCEGAEEAGVRADWRVYGPMKGGTEEPAARRGVARGHFSSWRPELVLGGVLYGVSLSDALTGRCRMSCPGLSSGQIKPTLSHVWETPPLRLLLSPWWSRLSLFHTGAPLSVSRISLVCILKRPDRKHQNNSFTIWKNTTQGIS